MMMEIAGLVAKMAHEVCGLPGSKEVLVKSWAEDNGWNDGSF